MSEERYEPCLTPKSTLLPTVLHEYITLTKIIVKPFYLGSAL